MSQLILPPGVPPPPNDDIKEEMPPEEILESVRMLQYGITSGNMVLLKRKNAGEPEADPVWDLAVLLPHQLDPKTTRVFAVATLIPQKLANENEPSTPAVQESSTVH